MAAVMCKGKCVDIFVPLLKKKNLLKMQRGKYQMLT